MPKFKGVKVSLTIPLLGKVEGDWEPDEREREASWEMYVELVTRISVVQLGPDEGLLREALTSLYSLFGTTRSIMRQHGPSVARPKAATGGLSFGYLAVAILNTVLRPVLAKWHPLLLDYEKSRPETISTLEHERRWDRNKELRDVLDKTRDILLQYANILADVAEVPPLVFSPEKK
jgi:hypothetical protein